MAEDNRPPDESKSNNAKAEHLTFKTKRNCLACIGRRFDEAAMKDVLLRPREKLGIMCALSNKPKVTLIHVQNLWVCDDCYTVILNYSSEDFLAKMFSRKGVYLWGLEVMVVQLR